MMEINSAIHRGIIRLVAAYLSGGMDSALSSYIAYKLAKVKGIKFVLVHIDTTVNVPETEEYVSKYAKWLNAELVVLRPEKTFKEYAKEFPYWPSLVHARWCKYYLKIRPIAKFLSQFPEYSVLEVTGIRQGESLFREKEFNKQFNVLCDKKHGRPCTYVWHPILRLSKHDVIRLVHQFGIPENPVWRKLGFSGECLCLAGTPRRNLDRLIQYYPDVAKQLAEIDDVIHAHRSVSYDSYPPALVPLKVRLKVYVEKKLAELKRQTLMDMYFEYEGKSCSSCMF